MLEILEDIQTLENKDNLNIFLEILENLEIQPLEAFIMIPFSVLNSFSKLSFTFRSSLGEAPGTTFETFFWASCQKARMTHANGHRYRISLRGPLPGGSLYCKNFTFEVALRWP